MPRPKPLGPYLETPTGNKVSRRAQLHGTQHIFLTGRAVIDHGVCIRGDLCPPPPSKSTSPSKRQQKKEAGDGDGDGDSNNSKENTTYATSVSIGRYTFLAQGCILRPPHGIEHQGSGSTIPSVVYSPLKIGDHVFIGPNSIIEAASIGDHVYVGAGAIVGRMAVLKDGVKVLEGSVVPGGMVVSSGSVVGGVPGRVVGEVGEGWGMYEGMEGGDMRAMWRGVGREEAG